MRPLLAQVPDLLYFILFRSLTYSKRSLISQVPDLLYLIEMVISRGVK